MGNEGDNDNGGDKVNEDGSGTNFSTQSMRPVPPPEAFQHADGFHRPAEQNSRRDNSRKDQVDNKQLNGRKTNIVSAAATTTAMLAPQRPSTLIRRHSSLFGQLPGGNKKRLFDDIVTSNSNAQNMNDSNAIGNTIVAETMMTSATNLYHSQSTWLQDDHQSILFGDESQPCFLGDTKSQSRTENPMPQEQKQDGKSSLFGAVMRKFGSTISSVIPALPHSPFGNKKRRSSGSVDASPQENGRAPGDGGGGFPNLTSSPSGKTIIDMVTQIHSPFIFQSPSSSHRKRQRRRDGNNDNDSAENAKYGEVDAFATPTKLFSPHDPNDSRSSLGGGLFDESLLEVPIVDMKGRAGVRMEVLDWSLVTKVRIEAHGKTSIPITETWIRDAMRGNEEALTYWIYRSPIVIEESINTPQSSGLLSHKNSSSNFTVLQKSIGTTKTSMSRHGSFSSRFDAKLLNGKSKSSNKKGDENDLSSSANCLAKHLIQSVRGPRAKYSRKRVLEENSWWDERVTSTSTSTTLREDSRERSQRQWQQALRSLFSNFRRRVLCNNDLRDILNTMVLDTYFYCVGQDHSVLFRISAGSDRDGDFNTNGNKSKAVPVVLVSSTSDSFRKHLESNGMDLTYSIEGDESFQFLESIQEREARERKKIVVATAAAARKNKRIFDNVLLSPGVRADLEALRRVQAFGESAGADVMVKVKKSGDGADQGGKEKEKLPKAIRISGWDNVSLFLEVYLNLFGDAMYTSNETATENGATLATVPLRTSKPRKKLLPLLICPNTNDFGPFEHASLKKLRLFPTERTPAADSKSEMKKNKEESSIDHGNAMEICGILLPCAIRKLLLVTRNRILKDEKMASTTNSSPARSDTKRIALESEPKNDDSDSSRYVVLHSSRPTIANNHKEISRSWIGGVNGSLTFNQGKKRKKKLTGTNENHGDGSPNGQNQVFECSYGNVVSMAVWDTSREEVAACKLDNAFPDNWIHRK